MADIESLQIEIQAALCSLSEGRLKEVCSGLKNILPPESKGRLVFIRALNKYFETEELDYEKLKGLSSSLSMQGKEMHRKRKRNHWRPLITIRRPSKQNRNPQYQSQNSNVTSRFRARLATCRRRIG